MLLKNYLPLISSTTLILVAATFVPAVYANSVAYSISFPHIIKTTQFAQGKWGNIRQSFQLEIPQNSSILSQINIDIPEGLSVKNDINIFEKSGREIPAATSVKGNKLTIIFPQAISPGNIISIDLNKVSRIGISNAWLYRVSAKFVGIDAEIPIGIAQFRLSY
ncbi:MAG: DUF2808 domain-containing protein [Nostoc sp.]|uniref:DUF2808 domain-containing protein n=1 Tax=Nostoc sp. TaxID=1180 RepID=UPI002FEFBA51